ncbi:MAG TPA: hypothetical protein VN736_24755 [Candidatus Limnocylindrales bacterium]|nr:hypothetical protein [Candidatus Limnocylindrales bacterium]
MRIVIADNAIAARRAAPRRGASNSGRLTAAISRVWKAGSTTAIGARNIASASALYVSSLLTIYIDLPDTPLRASASDQWLARRFYDERGHYAS